MPTAVGPNTKGEENLVFGYDLGDVANSYKGEPTTNVIAGTNLVNVVAGTFTTNTTVGGVRILENTQVNNSHVMWNGATGFIVTCSAGAYITVSAEYKTTCTIRMRFRDNPYDSQYDIDGGNIATISQVDVDIPNTQGEWVRYSATAQTSTANPDLWWYLVDYRNNNQFGRVEIRNWQIEVKSHPTPYVNGTRSATQGLIDLKGASTFNLVNVSFNSSAIPTFDGTDDFIGVSPRKQYSVSEPWTTELVFKPTDNNDTSWNGLFGGSLSAGGYWMFHNSGNLTYYEGYDGTTRITYRPWTKANTFTAGNYHHLVITYTPTSSTTGTYNLYYNGGQKTDSFGWTFGWAYSLDMQFIGAGDGRFGTNDVHYFKQYNKVLTAAEVASNFNAIKSRFSI